MIQQTKRSTHKAPQAVDAAELDMVNGGIWDYSNRLGILGEMLEARQDAKYGVTLTPKTLDAAARQALEGWVTVP